MSELLIAVGLGIMAVTGSYRYAMEWTFKRDKKALFNAAISPLLTVAPYGTLTSITGPTYETLVIILSIVWFYSDALWLIGLGASAQN